MNFQAGISETTSTSGLTVPFQLGGPLVPAKSGLSERLADGQQVSYSVSNGAKTEWWTGVFNLAANTISRGEFIWSTSGSAIDWNAGRKIIEIENGLPHGLNWDGTTFGIVGNILKFGKSDYPAEYYLDTPNSYLVIEAGDFDSDASVAMRVAGAIRWEAGMVGDTTDGVRHQSYHVKEVYGPYSRFRGAGETFVSRMVVHEPKSPRYPLVDFYRAPFGDASRVRVYGSGTEKPTLVIGNHNGKEYPAHSGTGLLIHYDLSSDIARIRAETSDAFFRDISVEANNFRVSTGPVNLNFDAMVLNSQGALTLANAIALADHANISNGGDSGIALMSAYDVGQVLTALGGTGTAPTFTVTHLQVASALIAVGHAGTGGTNGEAVLTGTTGTGTKFQVYGNIVGGVLTSLGRVTTNPNGTTTTQIFVTHGDYTVKPTSLTNEPVTGGGLTGCQLNIKMGALTVTKTTDGAFSVRPITPTATSSSGAGVGATLDIFYQNGYGSIDALEYWANGHRVIDNAGNWIGGSSSTIHAGLAAGYVVFTNASGDLAPATGSGSGLYFDTTTHIDGSPNYHVGLGTTTPVRIFEAETGHNDATVILVRNTNGLTGSSGNKAHAVHLAMNDLGNVMEAGIFNSHYDYTSYVGQPGIYQAGDAYLYGTTALDIVAGTGPLRLTSHLGVLGSYMVLDFDGNVVVGAETFAATGVVPYGNPTVVKYGATFPATIQLGTGAAQANGTIASDLTFEVKGVTTDPRIAMIRSRMNGASSTNIGGQMEFWAKLNAGALTQVGTFAITSTGTAFSVLNGNSVALGILNGGEGYVGSIADVDFAISAHNIDRLRFKTSTTGADNIMALGQWASGTGYNFISWNGAVTSSAGTGIYGGGSGDDSLYFNVPAASTYKFRFNGTTKLDFSSTLAALTGGLSINTGADRVILAGQWSASGTYNALSFNNSLSSTAGTIIFGGATGDDNLYMNIPTGAHYRLRINNSTVLDLTDVELQPIDNTMALGDATHRWTTVAASRFRSPEVTYANRPTSPSTGDEFNCSDSSTVTLGATIAGSGSNHVRAAYSNAGNWVVLGNLN